MITLLSRKTIFVLLVEIALLAGTTRAYGSTKECVNALAAIYSQHIQSQTELKKLDPLVRYQRGELSQDLINDLKRAGHFDQADALEEKITEKLKALPVTTMEPLKATARDAGPKQGVFLTSLGNGEILAVWKPQGSHPKINPGNEVAAYELDRILGTGVVPITIRRTIDGVTGSLQLFQVKAPSRVEVRLEGKEPPAIDPRIKVLRYIGGFQEGDGENVLWDSSTGAQFSIDHGIKGEVKEPEPSSVVLVASRVSDGSKSSHGASHGRKRKSEMELNRFSNTATEVASILSSIRILSLSLKRWRSSFAVTTMKPTTLSA